jgi:hypothetical protein
MFVATSALLMDSMTDHEPSRKIDGMQKVKYIGALEINN